MARILLLDNFDSFTYNLEHYLSGLGVEVIVCRNNAIQVDLNSIDAVVLSPGPGLPQDAPGMMRLIEQSIGKIPILGVCLGMQALAVHLNGELMNKEIVSHGVSSQIKVIDHTSIFSGLPQSIEVGLYHSWRVKSSPNYSILAIDHSDDTVMAIGREDLKCYGVQFHPESIMTPTGRNILESFLKMIRVEKTVEILD